MRHQDTLYWFESMLLALWRLVQCDSGRVGLTFPTQQGGCSEALSGELSRGKAAWEVEATDFENLVYMPVRSYSHNHVFRLGYQIG